MPKNVELLDNVNDILYPRTLAVQVAVTSSQTLDQKLNDMDTKIKDVTDEVTAARTDVGGQAHANLKARIDAIETVSSSANTTVNNIKQEVEAARGTGQNLKDRLDKMTAATTNAQNTADGVKAEVEAARDGQAKLKDRLDNMATDIDGKVSKTGDTMTGKLNANSGIGTTTGDLALDAANEVKIGKNTLVSGNVRLDGSSRSFQIDAAGRTNDVVKIDANNGDVKLGTTGFKATLMANADPKWSNGANEYEIWNQNNMPVQTGDWTPVFTAQGGGTMTPVDQTGKYFRFGNMVIVTFNYRGQNPRGFNGQLNLTGLPFTNATGTHVGVTIFALRGFNVGSNPIRQISAYVRPGESRIIYNLCDINNNTSNIGVLDHSHLATTTPIYEFSGTVVYRIN